MAFKQTHPGYPPRKGVSFCRPQHKRQSFKIPTVKKVKVFEKVFALFERYRRQRRISSLTDGEELLGKETDDEEFARLLEDQSKRNHDISEEEAMELASEAVAWSRKKIS